MTSRRAEELDHRLRDRTTRLGEPADDEVARLVRTARQLSALSPVDRSGRAAGTATDPGVPRQVFRTELRARLDAEAQALAAARSAAATRPAARPAASHRPRRRRPLVLAGLVASTVALGTATSVASSAALPGDLLYPFKRSAEDARLLVVHSEASRGAAELDLARERLGESWRLAASASEPDPAELEAALTDLGSTAGAAVTVLLADFENRGDPASLAEVQEFLVTAIPSLRDLDELLPPELRPVADDLVEQWVGVERSVARTALDCGAPCADVLG